MPCSIQYLQTSPYTYYTYSQSFIPSTQSYNDYDLFKKSSFVHPPTLLKTSSTTKLTTTKKKKSWKLYSNT